MAGNTRENIRRIVTSNSTKRKVRFIIIKRKIQVSFFNNRKQIAWHSSTSTCQKYNHDTLFALAVWFLALGVGGQREFSTNLAQRPTQRTQKFGVYSHRFTWETFRLQVICKNIAFDTSYILYKTAEINWSTTCVTDRHSIFSLGFVRHLKQITDKFIGIHYIFTVVFLGSLQML